MSVYVDDVGYWANETSPACFQFGSCHMYADTLEELHEMADKLSLRRTWFQNSANLQHYDLTPNKRDWALYHGVIRQDRKDAVAKWQQLRQQRASAK